MVNPEKIITISFNVPENYKFKGTELKRELDRFFQHVWDNAPEVFKSYENKEKIMEMLGSWLTSVDKEKMKK